MLDIQSNLEEENDKLRKSEELSNKTLSQLQEELGRLRHTLDEKCVYVRQLEQINDDLERSQRATVTSLAEFEGR